MVKRCKGIPEGLRREAANLIAGGMDRKRAALVVAKKDAETTHLADKIGYAKTTARRLLEDLPPTPQNFQAQMAAMGLD